MSEPTSAAAWRPPFETITLPSGNSMEVRDKFPAYLLLATGQLSDELFQGTVAMQSGNLEEVPASVAGELIELMISTLAVNPRISTPDEDGNVPEGHLSLELLSQEDADALLARALGGRVDESFRDDGDGTGGSGDSADVVDPPKRAARASKRKPGGTRSRPAAS